jgi:thiol-disulfide isomerase/thioredoxin
MNMSTNKKLSLVVIILLVVGSIWYLEMMKAHPSVAENSSGTQTLNVDPNASDTAMTGGDLTVGNSTTTSGASSTQVSGSAAHAALVSIINADKASGDQPAIEIVDPTGFVNASSGFTLKSLIGKKVILLDFWTYSCINCVRTIPYLNAWYQKYHNQGLEIVGIHTPEFDFEKQLSNVQTAVKNYGIQYPVILDSNYGTWDAYNNLYWPHEYLIDLAGYIVHDQVGEGGYANTETEIQKLLAQRALVLGTGSMIIATSTVNVPQSNLNEINSPETYFGAARNSLLSNGTIFTNGMQTLTTPSTIDLNKLYLNGTWNFEDQYATNVNSGASITYEYDAGNVYFVAAGAASGTTVEVLRDGKAITPDASGSDVHDGKVIISGNRLYNLVKNADGGGEHTLQLIIDGPGLQAFTFTFG